MIFLGLQRTYCSKKCKNKQGVDNRRKKIKSFLVEHKGSKCERCNWTGHQSAFVFHHYDPQLKDFAISKNGNTYSTEQLIAEVEKCILLCANCHNIVHAIKDPLFLKID